jgi:uncharacterized protein (DUF111 family)
MDLNLHTKEGCLFYVQEDHLTGEEIGSSIDRLYRAGAHNVQVIPTVTKKNRIGHLFLIDTTDARRNSVEKEIILSLRVSGWHCISTIHRYLSVDYLKEPLTVKTGNESFIFTAEIKKTYGIETTLRPENRSCSALQQKLADLGIYVSLHTCSCLILNAAQDCHHMINLTAENQDFTHSTSK